jgi:FtsP/CotA-like multicopper oxidase with cupredoxin domain
MDVRKTLVRIALVMVVLTWGASQCFAQETTSPPQMRSVTNAQRKAAATRAAARLGANLRSTTNFQRMEAAARQSITPAAITRVAPIPGGTPDYFGPYPNWAFSPSPTVDALGNVVSGGIRKFVDSLPGLGVGAANDLNQYIPVAIPDTTTYPGSDYYEISLVQYSQQLHKDLPATRLRGYVQTNTNDATVSVPSYLGPLIIAQRNRPVRVKFTNALPTGSGGNLFIPVDTTVMGAGMGPIGMNTGNQPMDYSQNRAIIHLHGGNTPWISDGTPHQWTTPATENTAYPKGVSVQYVPDMWYDPVSHLTVPAGTANATNNPGPGSLTFYYTNQQSARLMFYHDHSYGITRLNVYAGEAAGYLVTDTAEQTLVNGGTIGNLTIAPGTVPATQIPLIIQDKVFVDAANIAAQDPTWNWGITPGTPHTGDLWFPHVYMPNQNPYDIMGASAMGRWDYGPWFWPPFTGLINGPLPNPYYDPINAPWEPPVMPGIPNPSLVPEAFMDTPLVNGTVYPFLPVGQKAYRFRILNACNDRTLNLQLYIADPTLVNLPLLNVQVTNGGTGYTTAPTVGFTGGGGTGATATAFVDGGVVDEIVLTNPGTGYTSAPTVTITGVGTGATAIAMPTGAGVGKEVKMVAAAPNTGLPTRWPTDGRDGGVPDPATMGPTFYQIGTEGGLLPAVAVLPNTPIGYTYNRRDITVLNVSNKTLMLGPAERADVVVDFSGIPNGTNVLLYNDAPAPVPAFDSRNDYYTGDPDQTSTGGATTTQPGYGPNTRTIMQFQVTASLGTSPAFNLAALQTALPAAYAVFQDKPIIPQAAYNAAFNATYPTDAFVRIQDTTVGLPNGTITGLTLVNGGTGYTSVPTVSITGGGGTGATGTATLSLGSIASITVTNGGNNYTSAPTVTFTGGGGTGAAATAVIQSHVSTATVTSGGSGYATPPTVSFTGGAGTGAAATAVLAPAAVASLNLTNGGSGFTTAPSVSFTGGGGTGAAATTTLSPAAVASLAITNGGSGYSTPPTVSFTGGGGSGAAATVALSGFVSALNLTTGGSGYATPPAVSFTGGGGSGAAATARLAAVAVASLNLTNGGSGFTAAPTVVFTGGGGSGAAATANLATHSVARITVGNPGTRRYTSAPTVTITGGGGSGATAVANLTGGSVSSVTVTNGGSGYTSIPTVAFSGGGGSGATATASLSTVAVASLTLTNGGTGYTSAPIISFTGGGGTGAAASATLATAAVAGFTITNGGSGYSTAPTVGFSGGGGSGAAATATMAFSALGSLTLTNGGSGYTSAPAVGFIGGGGTGAAATATLAPSAVASINLTGGGSGYTSAPTVGFTGGGGTGAAATATLATSAVASLTITNGGTGYTSAPTVGFTGGGGTGAAATAVMAGYVSAVNRTSGGTGYSSVPTVGFTGGGGTGATATAVLVPAGVTSITLTNGGTGYTSTPTVAFVGGGGTGASATATLGQITMQLQPKAIQELFTVDYGRMNATLGVELPNTNMTIQTTIPYGYVDPPTEILQNSDVAAPIGSAADGTQIWKITHNGVDTHAIHFHLFNVQLINRVGWDGMVKPPDANEIGWKDTVRMNPLEDAIVAFRPLAQTLPWQLPNSVRAMDVTMPLGTTTQFFNVDPTNEPATVTNSLVNFGYEYVWHCHLLGHEENDMMRPMILAVAPVAPSNLTVTRTGSSRNQSVRVSWRDNSLNETGFIIDRATSASGPWTTITTVAGVTGMGTTLTYSDTTVSRRTTYYYRVTATNVVGYTQTYAAPVVGYPSMAANTASSVSGPVSTN